MYPASSEEGDWPGGGEEALMLNKLSVLFVSLRPSQAIFFFFKSNRYMTVISSVRKKPAIAVFAQKG